MKKRRWLASNDILGQIFTFSNIRLWFKYGLNVRCPLGSICMTDHCYSKWTSRLMEPLVTMGQSSQLLHMSD